MEQRLNKANLEIEERDYQKTIVDVKRLPIDDRYENKALSLYTVFLSKYPNSSYAKSITTAIDGIRQNMATVDFDGLKKIPADDFLARYKAYQAYLDQFPKGAERKAVNRMLTALGDQSYQVLEKQTAACNTQKAWDDCIAKCDRFLADFAKLATVGKVEALRRGFQDKADLIELTVKAELAGDDFVYAKQIYTDYLATRPDSTQKSSILERIDVLDGELAKKAAWKKTEAYATDRANAVTGRIQRVEAYVQKKSIRSLYRQGPGPF